MSSVWNRLVFSLLVEAFWVQGVKVILLVHIINSTKGFHCHLTSIILLIFVMLFTHKSIIISHPHHVLFPYFCSSPSPFSLASLFHIFPLSLLEKFDLSLNMNKGGWREGELTGYILHSLRPIHFCLLLKWSSTNFPSDHRHNWKPNTFIVQL